MSAANSAKAKTNCDAVNSGTLIINQPININSTSANSKAIRNANNGTKLNQKQEPVIAEQEISVTKLSKARDPSGDFQNFQSQNFTSDVQKVLKQEQELQKQLYSGSNVAPGWLRVNHNNKVIYISPSGIGLASLKQVKDYLLTRGTCKCGLPFPLRVEFFFNFNTEVPTVPLKTPIESIKFDPTCKHRKRLTSSQTANNNQTDTKRSKLDTSANRSTGECLLPSYVTSATSKIISQSATNSTVMILNNGALTASNVQPQIIQSKPQQVTFHQQQRSQQPQQFVQHDPSTGANVVMRVVKDDGDADGVKLPPWKKNSIVQQKCVQQTQMVQSGIPIFQINGQNVIAIDQNNQQYHIQQPQQIQIIEQKCDGSENWTTVDGKIGKTIIRRRPTFKEDPTGYLNQQTQLLHNTITTLHSPDGSTSTTSSASPQLQENPENYQRTQIGQRQFIQQFVKAAPSQVTTIGGQTLTHMPNGIVQIQQNCDIRPQAKPMMIQEQIHMQQNKFIRQNPKGRPPKNPQTIAKRLVAMSQESPVSSTSAGNNMMKLVKSNTPDISSSSHTPEAITETIVHSSSFDNTEYVKFARTASTQEMIRTSMTQVVAGKAITNTTTASSMMKKPQTMTMMKKPQTVIGQVKSAGNIITQNTSGQQIMMTSNGQQFIVMPSTNIQQQPHNIMLNNNLMQIQNTNTSTNQRLIQAPGQGGNILIQTSTGNVLATNPMSGGNFIVSNGQQLSPLIIQNGQIIQNNGNLISGPKGNIMLSNGPGGKTIISNNGQLSSPMLGQQTVLINGVPTQTIIQDSSSFMQNTQQQAQRTITMNPEKKKGRKRKIPLPENQQINIQQSNQQTIQAQQSGMIQMTPQGFQLTSPNILLQNKLPQPQQGQQIILQNGQTLIQQPMNLFGGQQLMLPSGQFPVMLTQDGNQIVQLQSPQFNNIIQTPQGMMIRTPLPQQQQQIQKTIITNNGQQYIVNQPAGQMNQMNQVFNSSMGFIVQAQQNQQQQIINAQQPIMMHSPNQGQQIITQPQIITQSPSGMSQGTMIGQQTQYITQSDDGKVSQRKIIHQKVQQQKFFPQMMKPPRTVYGATKNPIQTIVQEIEQPEEDEEEMPDEEQEEVLEEMEPEEQELSFDDDKPDMIQELHHGSQQVLHHSLTGDGQYGIMNIDDITIEMDEINDINEYLNAIDEEDNRMAQMGLSSLQQFANSPPDTTTHSPRSPIQASSDKSNGSSDSTNMVQFVSSSEPDSNSNVVSPEGVDSQMSPPQHLSHYSGNTQAMFKLPMDPKSNMKSPMSHSHMQMNLERNQKSPLMRPDSHESASSDHLSDTPKDDEVPAKSDFDLLKESPPVNTIKPVVTDTLESEDSMSTCQNSPIQTASAVEAGQTNANFTIGDLIWGATRGCDAWPGKVVNGPDGEPTSSDCVWVKWFGGRQNTEMMRCTTLKSLSEGLEAHHAAQKDTRKGRKLNSHLERAIQKAMTELDKQSNVSKGNSEKKAVASSHKSPKTKLFVKIAPAPDKK